MPKIEILLNRGIGKVRVDGLEIREVTQIEIFCSPLKPTKVKLEVLATELSLVDEEAETETTIRQLK